MNWLATRSMVVSSPRWRSLSLFLRSPAPTYCSFVPSRVLLRSGYIRRISCFKDGKILRGSSRAAKKHKSPKNNLDDKDLCHIFWWKEWDIELKAILHALVVPLPKLCQKMQMCRKPSTAQLVKRLEYSNLLGLDPNLKNGSLKEGTLNWEMLQFKSKFPREVLLCRVGDFYESIGIDACILVEYAGLNPFGGMRSDSIPKAGCPVVVMAFAPAWIKINEQWILLNPFVFGGDDGTFVLPKWYQNWFTCPAPSDRNLRQTLDDLTRNGFSVCIVEEVQGPTQARSRKGRFISGHAHPGNPYVYGLVGVDHDLDFPEPMPVVGISRSARGYCINFVLETMKTYSSEDGLTEEAVVTKLRTCLYHHLFLHTSLRRNSSETFRWGEYGEGGLLWGECSSRHFEWFDGDPISDLLVKVKELYGLEDEVTFRNTTVSSENRPRPLTLGTATQIGAIPTEGIPYLLKILLPPSCTGLPVLYVRDLLLNPPAYEIASTIQAICKLMSCVTCSIPEFTCVSSAKLVKLLGLREANHIEFCRIKHALDEILLMHRTLELNEILKLLIDPTWVATGLKIDFETLVAGCEVISDKIGETIYLDGENDQKINSFSSIPDEFFEDMESSWKGRVKRIHIDDAFIEVQRAAEALSLAVEEDFVPIISRIKATAAPLGGPKGEILYAREHEAVWFKGKRFAPTVWAGSPGEEQIKQLKPALDSKGRKVGEEWFTTIKVEAALTRYHESGEKAKARVLELLRGLSAELQSKINILVFASMLLIIAKALFSHVSEGRRRRWVFPTLAAPLGFENAKTVDETNRLKIVDLLPYWFNVAEGGAVHNTIDMQSLFLLTGPNGGGKSSLLRSICAASLLGICGFMVPAKSALIPHFDSIMLHMKSFDSPADGKSSFQVEMSEIRSIIAGTTKGSLVLVDEICRGTETAKGTCIAGSIIETFDRIGCLGIVSTHLHGIFDLPLNTNNIVYKAMGTVCIDGQTKPTWKLMDGVCKESLAFETAEREGIPESIIQRAEDLYLSVSAKELLPRENSSKQDQISSHANVNNSNESHLYPRKVITRGTKNRMASVNQIQGLHQKVESAIFTVCQERIMELQEKKNASAPTEIKCVLIGPREQPPPSTIGASSVYVIIRPDKKLYVGETDDLAGRVHAHRTNEGIQNASFLYFLVPGKSLACQLETLLINQLPAQGFQLTNVADGKHRNFGTSNLLSECVATPR